MIGYSSDLKGSQEKAKKLLADAGVSGMTVELLNRAVDQPYKVVGTWMLGQWKKVGLVPNQIVLPTGPWYAKFRKKKDQETMIDFNCQGVVNPLIDASKWQSSDIATNNRGNYIDRQMDKWYDQMNRTGDEAEAASIMRKYEMRGLGFVAGAVHLIVPFVHLAIDVVTSIISRDIGRLPFGRVD
jgi:peptide/nickel transport system substrate-binding protein